MGAIATVLVFLGMAMTIAGILLLDISGQAWKLLASGVALLIGSGVCAALFIGVQLASRDDESKGP